jgi:hypothetical protein
MLTLLRNWERNGMEGGAEEAFATGIKLVQSASSGRCSELTAKYITYAAMHEKAKSLGEAAEGATTSNDIAFTPDQFGPKRKRKPMKEEGTFNADQQEPFNQDDEDKRRELVSDDKSVIRGKDIADMLKSRSRQQN